MNKETEHTPLPFEITPSEFKSNGFHYSANGCEVIEIRSNPVSEWVCAVRGDGLKQAKTNAAFIVRACNNHDALVAALKRARHDIIELTDAVERDHPYYPKYIDEAIKNAEQ